MPINLRLSLLFAGFVVLRIVWALCRAASPRAGLVLVFDALMFVGATVAAIVIVFGDETV